MLVGAFGNIDISKSGSVDASFKIPEFTPIDLGSNPLVVSADLTIPVFPFDMTQVHSGYFLLVNDCRIWQGDGVTQTQSLPFVTGLQVDKGVTLTLGLNKSTDNTNPPDANSGEDQCRICFYNDVHILGTIKTQDLTFGNVPYEFGGLAPIPDIRHGDDVANSNDKGSLEIEAFRIVMEDSGLIDTSGADGFVALAADLSRGGDGGGVELENNRGIDDWLSGGGIFLKGGSIDATGGDGANSDIGGDGAVVSGEWHEITLQALGVIINRAALNASGGNSGPGVAQGSLGGFAGDVELDATSSIYNTGPLTANGGFSNGWPVSTAPTAQSEVKDGLGFGGAGSIELISELASIFNSGALTANGGGGVVGACGGWIWLLAAGTDEDEIHFAGQIKNSGPLLANGGDSIQPILEGQPPSGASGGEGGAMFFETYGGSIKNSGSLTANGGAGWGTFPDGDKQQPTDGVPCGGDGGCVHFFDDLGLFPPIELGIINTAKAPEPIEVTGNISLLGGKGPCGGDGGALIALNGLCPLNLLDPRSVGTIAFKGYGKGPINLNGGAGGDNDYSGGGGELIAACGLSVYGLVSISAAAPSNGDPSGLTVPFGSVTNKVPIQAMGGPGTSFTGGYGGLVMMGLTPCPYFPPQIIDTVAVKNSASIDVSGGTGTGEDDGGNGGEIWLVGHDLAENTGNLTANGGDSVTPLERTRTKTAPDAISLSGGGEIVLLSSYDVHNVKDAKISVNGGSDVNGFGDGGDAGEVTMYAGNHVANDDSIFANGGNGVTDGDGGAGGEIDLFSEIEATSTSSDETLEVKGGTGFSPEANGENGHILIDFTDVTPPDGTLP
jgi:hypothetical protein